MMGPLYIYLMGVSIMYLHVVCSVAKHFIAINLIQRVVNFRVKELTHLKVSLNYF